jgi:hypothetical protein
MGGRKSTARLILSLKNRFTQIKEKKRSKRSIDPLIDQLIQLEKLKQQKNVSKKIKKEIPIVITQDNPTIQSIIK